MLFLLDQSRKLRFLQFSPKDSPNRRWETILGSFMSIIHLESVQRMKCGAFLPFVFSFKTFSILSSVSFSFGSQYLGLIQQDISLSQKMLLLSLFLYSSQINPVGCNPATRLFRRNPAHLYSCNMFVPICLGFSSGFIKIKY